MPPLEELVGALSKTLQREWDEESLDALNSHPEACVGLAIAHGVNQGWLITPLPDEALESLSLAYDLVQEQHWNDGA